MEISAIDTMWVLFGTMFIFFMHSGFALLETGFSRVKNSSTAWIDNLLDFAIASLVFWAFGYGIMFGNSNPFIGEFNFVAMNSYPELNPTIPSYANVMFHGAICATTAAVVSGAMLERVNFKSFLIYSTIISGFVYPVVGHWACLLFLRFALLKAVRSSFDDLNYYSRTKSFFVTRKKSLISSERTCSL